GGPLEPGLGLAISGPRETMSWAAALPAVTKKSRGSSAQRAPRAVAPIRGVAMVGSLALAAGGKARNVTEGPNPSTRKPATSPGRSTPWLRLNLCKMSSSKLRIFLQQPRPHRLAHGRGLGVDLELLVHVADVVAHRVDADAKLIARGLVAATFGQQTQKVNLLRREPFVQRHRRRIAPEKLHNLAGDFGRHGRAAVACLAYRFENARWRRGLEQVADGAVAQRFENLVLVGGGGEHEHRRPRPLLAQRGDALRARHSRELDVEQHHVRRLAAARGQRHLQGAEGRVATVARRAHHEHPETLASEPVVLDDRHADGV